MRQCKSFDFQREDADSDIYSDIALNLPTAHLSSPTGSTQLRIVVDDFGKSSADPLAEMRQFEKDVAPILLFVFVDCTLSHSSIQNFPPEN